MIFDELIARERESDANERANKDFSFPELCDILDVPRPDPATSDPDRNRDIFEKPVVRVNEGEQGGEVGLWRSA